MTSITPVDRQGYQRLLAPAFQSVFEYVAPFGAMFTARMEARGILYPTFPQLALREFQALSYAGQAAGDDQVCLSLLDNIDDPDYIQHWLLSLENGEDYFGVDAPHSVLENALYSPAGKWGIRLTLQRFGIVGGSSTFVTALFDQLSSSPEIHTHNFLVAYKTDPYYFGNDANWLDGFLSHLYGHEKSQSLLSTVGLL